MTEKGTQKRENMTALWAATCEERGVGLTALSKFSICRRYSFLYTANILIHVYPYITLLYVADVLLRSQIYAFKNLSSPFLLIFFHIIKT